MIDRPAGAEGRVYLVERAAASQAELDGIVSEYCKGRTSAGEPALLASRRIFDARPS